MNELYMIAIKAGGIDNLPQTSLDGWRQGGRAVRMYSVRAYP